MKYRFFRFLGRVRKLGHAASVKKHESRRIDMWLLIAALLLSFVGLLMVYDSSVAIAIRDFSNPYHFVRDQVQWLVLGIVLMLITSRVNYHFWYGIALPFLLVVFVFLIAVFLPGIGIHALGASRWVNLGFTSFQPAELAKLALVVYLSAWFSAPERHRLLPFLLLLAMMVGLVLLEPDLGTSIILLASALFLYFYSGAPVWHFALLVPMFAVGVAGLALASPYRFARLLTFFNPEHDPLGASYQMKQVLLALGSGGIFGVGIGKSRQKYEYLPEANTDSIFAILSEETGFLGATVVMLLFLFLLSRAFRIAKRAPDRFGKLLALGISSWIGIQVCINLAAMVALVPLTGVPLPFISYGGSNLVVTLVAVGILLNISKFAYNR